MNVISSIIVARDFAIKAHGNQRYGDEPYFVHLDEVAGIACNAAMSLSRDNVFLASVVTVAYVHDVLEDTDVDQSAIGERLGAPVATCAELLSDPPGKNRKERKEALHLRLSELDASTFVGQAVLIVKASDRLANLRRSAGLDGRPGNPGLLKMYLGEAPAFRQAAYRPGLCDAVWQEIDRICPP